MNILLYENNEFISLFSIKTNIFIQVELIIYVFSLQVSETQTYYAGGLLQTPSKSFSTLLPGYIALNKCNRFVVL